MSRVNRIINYARNGQVEQISQMLTPKFKQKNEPKGPATTALHVTNSPEVILLMIEHGADVNHLNCRQETPLFCAVNRVAFDAVKCLVENGADVNAKNFMNSTPLHYAVKQKYSLPIIKYLIAKGADSNSKDRHGCTPLYKAIVRGNLDIVKYLVKSGADPSICSVNGYNAYNYCNNKPEIKKFLEKYKLVRTYFDLWSMDSEEFTLFFQWLPEEILDDVLSLIVDEFYGLYQTGQINIPNVNQVFKAEWDFDNAIDGQTILHIAVRAGNVDLVKQLIEKGADVNLLNNDGCVPLQRVDYGDFRAFDMVKLLIENGADVSMCDPDGVSLLQYAIDQKNEEVEKYFREQIRMIKTKC